MSKCSICRAPFERKYLTQKTCLDPICKQEQKRQEARKKAERADRKARKEKIKTRSDYIKEAQIAFNAFIRERDKARPCICCGHPLGEAITGGAYDAGHYRSVGSAPHLRFDERNCHAQRKVCNRYGSGRAVDYRIGLIKRLGADAVESIESDQSVKKWTKEELIVIRDHYRAKLKIMKSEGPAVDVPALQSTTLIGETS